MGKVVDLMNVPHGSFAATSARTLAAQFIERGLVDEYQMVVHPVVLGAGTPFLPPGVSRFDLRLTGSRAFASGAMYLDYEVVP